MRNIVKFLGVLTAALFANLAPAAAADDVFVVPRVPVSAQGESATAAKAAAQMQGRRRAIDILLRRITVEEDWGYLPRTSRGQAATSGGDATLGKTPISLSDNGLEALEQSFEVYGEKSSASTYRAYITYRFKPDAVRRLLKNARIPYSETQMRKALVLPVLQTDKATYLWEGNNPWMAAWKARPYINELTPMTTPIGDLEDSRSVTAANALALNGDGLGALARRYSVSQIIVAHARLRQQGGEDQLTVRLISAYRENFAPAPALDSETEAGAAEDEALSVAPAAAPEDDFSAQVGDVLAQATYSEPTGHFPGLAERAIEGAIAKYADVWKGRTLIDHSHEAILDTTAFFDSLNDWTKIRAGLLATPLVGSVQVFALSPRGAEMRLRVFGDPRRLGVAMENYGVTFWTEDGQRWFLANPSRAGQLRGSKLLRQRRGAAIDDRFAPDQIEAPEIEPASEYAPEDSGTKIDQPN